MQTLLLIFLFNIALHIILGFGMTEVYIMSGHWIFIFPLTYTMLIKKYETHKGISYSITLLLLAITAYLLTYHATWLHYYLTWPVRH